MPLRPTLRLSALPAALLLACMAPAEAEELIYDDDDDARSLGGEPWIPEGEREPRPVAEASEDAEAAEPEPEVRAIAHVPGAARYRMLGDGGVDNCVEVSAVGFPAIDATGMFVATSHEQWLQLTPFPGMTTLRIIPIDSAAAEQTISIVPDDAFDRIGNSSCRALRTQVRDDVRLANAELASRGFRSVEPLAVEYGNAEAEPGTYIETPAHERPLQVVVQHQEAIVRIPGVKVYERLALGDADVYSLWAVHGDRNTGTVVLTFADCRGDSCTCDPLFTAVVMHWDADTFAALDAHPCADPEAEDGVCRGIDYGF